MNDTVGDQDISDNNASVVDEDPSARLNGNGEVLALSSLQDGAIAELGRVSGAGA